MNNRDFKKRLQAIAHGEVPREEQRKPPVKEAPPERKRSVQKQAAAKKPPVKSDESMPKVAQVRVRRRAL